MLGLFALLLVLVVIGAVAAVVTVVAVQRRNRDADNQVVPGVTTRAPSAWAGSHDPEARLHRRLRDAVRALRASAPVDAGLRVQLEQQALGLDEALVGVTALPPADRVGPLAHITAAVEALEAAAAGVAGRTAEEAATRMAGALTQIGERQALLEQARVELDRSEQRAPGLTDPPPS